MTSRWFEAARKAATTLGAAALAATALVAGPANAQMGAPWHNADGSPTTWLQVCIDAWEDAPAEAYCSATVTRLSKTSDADSEYCYVNNISCSATVSVTDGDATTQTVFTTWEHGFIESATDTDEITLCWSQESDDWEMNLSAAECDSDETDLSTATSTGL
jgi:hypothetical protein